MKNILFFIALYSFTTIAQETKKVSLAEFDEIVVYGQFTIDIKQSKSNESWANITIGYDDVDYDKISFNYTGKKLAIKYPMSVIKDRDLNITIYCPDISKVEARSGCQIRVDKSFVLSSEIVTLHAFAGGKIQAVVNTPQLFVTVNQGGSVSVTGTATLMEAAIKTGGTIGAVNLDSKKVNAQINLGGEIICFAEEILNANVTGGGTISYVGNPKVSQTIKLGGTVEKLK
jgi:hypothetical protein